MLGWGMVAGSFRYSKEERVQEQTSPPLSWCSVPHHVLALGICQQGCRTDAGMCCEQRSLFRTNLEALVIIIKFAEVPIVFPARLLACWYSLCYKQGQGDPKWTLSQRMSFGLAQVMSLDSFIPSFALEKWGGIRRCSMFESWFLFQPSVSRPLWILLSLYWGLLAGSNTAEQQGNSVDVLIFWNTGVSQLVFNLRRTSWICFVKQCSKHCCVAV